MVERRPFHETIVEVIKTAYSGESLYALAGLINMTIIPSNHDQIAAAWKEKLGAVADRDDWRVLAGLAEQKEIALAKLAQRALETAQATPPCRD